MAVDFFIRFELSFWNGLVTDVWENSKTSCFWRFEVVVAVGTPKVAVLE